jgi:hypothetical protein
MSTIQNIIIDYQKLVEERNELQIDQGHVTTSAGMNVINTAMKLVESRIGDMKRADYIQVHAGLQAGKYFQVIEHNIRGGYYVTWKSESEPDNYNSIDEDSAIVIENPIWAIHVE